MNDNYEDYLYREQCEGPVHWCMQCERQYEDCICEEISDHFHTALGGHADSDGVSVPLSLSAPPPGENALTEFDRVALSGGNSEQSHNTVKSGDCAPSTQSPVQIKSEPLSGNGSDTLVRGEHQTASATVGSNPIALDQSPVQILNQTFDKVMRHFKI